MDKNSFTSNFKKYSTVIICLATILVIEITTYGIFNSLLPRNPTTMNVYSRYQLAKTANKPVDILILGDSSCGSAISASQLGQQLNKKVVALNTGARTALMGNYFILEEYLNVNEPPEKLLIMFVYDVWPRSLSDWAIVQVINLNFRDKIWSLLNSPGLEGYQFFLESTVKFLQPSRLYKWEYKRLIGSGMSISEYRQNGEKYLEESIERLYNPLIPTEDEEEEMFYKPDQIEKDLEKQIKKVKSTEFNVSKLNEMYMEKIIEICMQNGIEVYYIPHVVHSGFYNDPDGKLRLQAIRSFLRNYEVNYPNFKVLIEHYLVSTEGLSNSIDHANRNTRKVFTNIVAEELK